MKRLIANISGDIAGAGYSKIVATLAGTLDIKGYIEILSDGRAFVIAEGEKKDLEIFASAICIDNQRITVKKILADYREPTGEYHNFQELSPKADEKNEMQIRESMAGSCHFTQAPEKMEKAARELCKPHQDIFGIGPDLENEEKSIEPIGYEKPGAESGKLQPEIIEKLSLNK